MSGCNSCVPLPDGRVLLIPWSATNPLIYDPKRDAITVSAASTPAELQTGADFTGGVLLPDGRVLLVPNNAPGALVYDPAADSLAAVAGDLGGACCGGGVLLADGRVLLPINFGLGKTLIFDPATDTITVTTPPSAAGGFAGGALLADGTVLLLPGTYSDLLECRIWDPQTDIYTPAPELARPCRRLGWARTWAGACCRTGGWCSRRGTHATWWCGSRGWGRSTAATSRCRPSGITGHKAPPPPGSPTSRRCTTSRRWGAAIFARLWPPVTPVAGSAVDLFGAGCSCSPRPAQNLYLPHQAASVQLVGTPWRCHAGR